MRFGIIRLKEEIIMVFEKEENEKYYTGLSEYEGHFEIHEDFVNEENEVRDIREYCVTIYNILKVYDYDDLELVPIEEIKNGNNSR